eukprot:TRINITY_DN8509_c0_g1_i4.p1 TRINITY_DN8509_c0_g1~~TRINITY_DN8509_c0_g1_i4.p1  ORF type:complete len:423 (-),score=39.13 TRINITY_DN8509_c0_g1_i4:112-1380(-)
MACPRLPELLVTLGHGGSDLPKLAAKELQALGAEDVERSGQARIFVRLPQTFEVDVDKLAALQAPEKVYAIVMRVPTDELMPQLPADGSGPDCEDALAKIIAESHGWAAALDLWRTVTRRPPEALKPSFRVTGSRAGKKAAHLRSNGIAEATGEAVMLVHKWQVELKEYDLEVAVNLNDETLLVLLPLLARAATRQNNFACPGLTQPVAWAMARSLEIKPGEVVMDPMCGSGIVLLEAAQCWRHAFYLGFDVEPSQLERSVANTKLLAGHIGRTISIQRGDASRLPLSSGSVDAVVCDLPFGKQFGSPFKRAPMNVHWRVRGSTLQFRLTCAISSFAFPIQSLLRRPLCTALHETSVQTGCGSCPQPALTIAYKRCHPLRKYEEDKSRRLTCCADLRSDWALVIDPVFRMKVGTYASTQPKH